MRDKTMMQAMKKIPAFAERVAPVYVALGWKWHSNTDGTGGYIPTAAAIESTLMWLWGQVNKADGDSQVRTGGLSVWCEKDNGQWEAGMDMTISEEVYG